MLQSLRNRQGIHLAPDALARFERRLQKVSGNCNCQRVGDRLPGSFFVFLPCWQRQRNPDGPAIHQEFDVRSIGMSRGNGNDQRLIQAVHFFLSPAIMGVKVAIHDESRIATLGSRKQTRELRSKSSQMG